MIEYLLIIPALFLLLLAYLFYHLILKIYIAAWIFKKWIPRWRSISPFSQGCWEFREKISKNMGIHSVSWSRWSKRTQTKRHILRISVVNLFWSFVTHNWSKRCVSIQKNFGSSTFSSIPSTRMTGGSFWLKIKTGQTFVASSVTPSITNNWKLWFRLCKQV